MFNTKPNNLKKIYSVLEKHDLQDLIIGGINLDEEGLKKISMVIKTLLGKDSNVINEILNLMVISDSKVDYHEDFQMNEIIKLFKDFFSFMSGI